MKRLIHSAKSEVLLIAVAVLISLVCLSSVQGVTPPPDGGYPNFTTAEGTNALKNLTSGAGNTGVGWYSLFSDTAASFNTGVGTGTLVLNTGDENTAVGTAALLFNTASGNTAIGSRALLNNTTGGTLANIQGVDVGPNVAVGQQALESNTLAGANTAVGYQALHSFTSGPTGFEQIGLCTAVGFQALANTTGTGAANNALGYQALYSNTAGGGNTAIGLQALFNNTTGSANVAIANNALGHNDTGENNIAIGANSLIANIGGSQNIGIGFDALGDNTTGSNNTALGAGAGTSVTTADNVICVGANVSGADLDNSCFIGNIWNQPGGSQAVYVNADGKLGALVSSRRFKEEVKSMDAASHALFGLRPVTFRYTKQIDPAGTPQFGLVAEEVEKVNPDLVVHDKDGKPYSVRYDQVNAMLLNEFLKEHNKVEKLEATVARQSKDFQAIAAEQKKEIQALTATVREQAAQIQKVSVRLEMTESRSRTVLNDPQNY